MTEHAGCQGDHPVIRADWPVHEVPRHLVPPSWDPPGEEDECVQPDDSKTGELGRRRMEICLGQGNIHPSERDLN
jgi:hypothetical protein